MGPLSSLEDQLDKIVNKSLPPLPSNAKKFIVTIAPWVALAGGVLSLWSIYALWQGAHIILLNL